jgi:4-hydroxybenzoate polyprenyltransferase
MEAVHWRRIRRIGLRQESPLAVNSAPEQTFRTRLNAVLRLARWKEHILFTLPLTVLGVNMAVYANDLALTVDYRLPALLVGNILAVTCAFMINDVEDAPDDAREAARAARNPVSGGELTPREGWAASLVTALLALGCYAFLPLEAFLTGALTVILAFLYSWRGVRLKAWPVIDVVSHVLLLSALLFLAGYLAYHSAPGEVWLVAVGVALVSAYGQLYNQLRDYAMDRAAGLRNTASILGPRHTRRLMYAALALAVLCLVLTVLLGLWPLWLIAVPVLMAPLLVLFRPGTDMRGTEAIDASGRLQWGAMIIANCAVLIWLLVNIVY